MHLHTKHTKAIVKRNNFNCEHKQTLKLIELADRPQQKLVYSILHLHGTSGFGYLRENALKYIWAKNTLHLVFSFLRSYTNCLNFLIHLKQQK